MDTIIAYKTIFDTLPDGVVITNQLGKIVSVNNKTESLFGYSKDELIGCEIEILIHEKYHHTHTAIRNNFAQNPFVREMSPTKEFWAKRKDNSEFLVLIMLSPLNIEGKKYISATIRDITSQKLTDEKLQRLNFALTATSDAIWEWDYITNKTFYSSRWFEMLGYEDQEFEMDFENWGKLCHPDDYQKTVNSIFLELSKPDCKGTHAEFRMKHKDGSWIWILARGNVVKRNDDGSPILISGTNTDISERKKVESALRESEEKYRTIFENVQDVFYRIDLQGTIQEISPSIRYFTGFNRENLIGQSVYNIYDKPADRELFLNEIKKSGVVKDYELSIRNENGELMYVSTNASIVFDTIGNPTHINGSLRDITHRRLNELEIESQNKKLQIQNKELEQFSYIASHDLQEPLRTLISFAELLKEEYSGKLDENADIYLNYILQSSGRMQNLVKGLLDYTRIGKERELSEVDCKLLIYQILTDIQLSISESNALITVRELPIIKAYSTEFRLLFQNLISNALKFREKDGNPEIEISVSEKEKDWLFAIKDNGIGIDKNDKDKIFIIFKRLHNRGEYEGTGIGLSHSKKIVELHGGQIWVESAKGNGSTFYFTIPKL